MLMYPHMCAHRMCVWTCTRVHRCVHTQDTYTEMHTCPQRIRAYIDTHAFRQDTRIRVHGRGHMQNMCVYVYVVYLHDYTEAFAFQIN